MWGDRELAEDACAFAWAQAAAGRLPDDRPAFAWLLVVAVREAWRLRRREQRELPSGLAEPEGRLSWVDTVPDSREVFDTLQAREALRSLSELRPRERRYLGLLVGGYPYREIAAMCGVSYTKVKVSVLP